VLNHDGCKLPCYDRPLDSETLGARMRICEYEVVIESIGGRELRRVTLTAATGHPLRGDEIEIESRSFVVRRVVHRAEGEMRHSTREYSFVRLHVQPRARSAWWRAKSRAG
jgi:hypothetical protein